MENSRHLSEILNDLIRINNNRIEAYQKCIKEAGDDNIDLKAIFSRMADESRQHVSQLSHEVRHLGEEPAATGTRISGKMHRAWMDVKAAFRGNDRLSLLETAAFEEDVAQHAYQEALTSEDVLSIDIRQLIIKQQEALKISYNTMKKFRDKHKKADSDDIVNSNRLRTSDDDLRSEGSLKSHNN